MHPEYARTSKSQTVTTQTLYAVSMACPFTVRTFFDPG